MDSVRICNFIPFPKNKEITFKSINNIAAELTLKYHIANFSRVFVIVPSKEKLREEKRQSDSFFHVQSKGETYEIVGHTTSFGYVYIYENNVLEPGIYAFVAQHHLYNSKNTSMILWARREKYDAKEDYVAFSNNTIKDEFGIDFGSMTSHDEGIGGEQGEKEEQKS